MTKEERQIILQKRLIELKKYEENMYSKGCQYIAGVDEVGRGSLAGPVVSAAVILPRDFAVLGVDDSKKLTPKKRDFLFDEIIGNALAYGIGQVENKEIDDINILEATKVSMLKAIKKADEMLYERTGSQIDVVILDAMRLDTLKIRQLSLVKGDSKSLSVAAASIVAKVFRDRKMIEYAKEYPGYSFETNKGYGTKAHYEGLHKQGKTKIHRNSFLKNMV